MGNLKRLVSLGLSHIREFETYFICMVCDILVKTAGSYPLETDLLLARSENASSLNGRFYSHLHAHRFY